MPIPRFAITGEPLAIEALASELERAAQASGEGCGAVCTFLGIVRATHKGRRVRYLDYEAFAPLALKTFDRIRDEIARDWPGALVAIHHRIGRLQVGEASVAIAAASAHRAQAFQVCRYAIERVKQIAPIWKHEYFDDGDAWVEGAVADVDDEEARRRAREVACA
jgi:molybdopterin synthase catalytic subunit